jgi:Zn-dependent M28 family amino/carboxypeptidase
VSSAASGDRLRAHVHRLAGEIGERNVFRPGALAEAASYISDEWASQGLETTPISYEVSGVECSNLEVTLAGETDEILVVGAHYDSVRGSPGANDNGTGVAALLELSRQLEPARRRSTLRLVAFVNEEPPFFRSGSMG